MHTVRLSAVSVKRLSLTSQGHHRCQLKTPYRKSCPDGVASDSGVLILTLQITAVCYDLLYRINTFTFSTQMSSPSHYHPGLLRFAVTRLREIRKREGTRGILNRILASMGYRRVGWYVHSLQDPITPVESRITFEFTQLSSGDVGRYVLFRRGAREQDILARLAAGSRCYAALCNGEIASVSWITEKQGYLELIGYRFPLEPDEIYLHDSFTAKKYRGNRIHSALYSRLLEQYIANGYRTAVTLIVPENRSNISARLRSGFKQTGSVARLKLGPFSWYRFRGECRPSVSGPDNP